MQQNTRPRLITLSARKFNLHVKFNLCTVRSCLPWLLPPKVFVMLKILSCRTREETNKPLMPNYFSVPKVGLSLEDELDVWCGFKPWDSDISPVLLIPMHWGGNLNKKFLLQSSWNTISVLTKTKLIIMMKLNIALQIKLEQIFWGLDLVLGRGLCE